MNSTDKQFYQPEECPNNPKTAENIGGHSWSEEHTNCNRCGASRVTTTFSTDTKCDTEGSREEFTLQEMANKIGDMNSIDPWEDKKTEKEIFSIILSYMSYRMESDE
jgi:hypothetical protein